MKAPLLAQLSRRQRDQVMAAILAQVRCDIELGVTRTSWELIAAYVDLFEAGRWAPAAEKTLRR